MAQLHLSAILVVMASFSAVSNDSIVAAAETTQDDRPNIIIVQPDDLQFYEDWSPPAHFDRAPAHVFPGGNNDPNSLPNMNYIRTNGLTMKQAYTASPKCGTSRYSTLTGRYPSRSSYGREKNFGETVPSVGIPTTKLQNEPALDGNDCGTGNLAALFSSEGYRTGMVGKWHLTNVNARRYDYAQFQQTVRDCGFDYAEAIYKDNIGDWAMDSGFHHNMEYVTAKGVQFIVDEGSPEDGRRAPFFLYFNPTPPHGPSVYDALVNYDCTDTPKGTVDITEVNAIPGMTADYNNDCVAYRQSILDRAHPSRENEDLGAIWVDDSLGALIKALNETDELENTFLLFQQDHGQEGKSSLFEPGIRIAQYIHFPLGNFATNEFQGVVSTIDIGPTICDYAGITSSSSPAYYSMDGRSWKDAVQTGSDWTEKQNDVCVVGEMEMDRSVVCGCDKYIRVHDETDRTNSGTVNDGTKNQYKLDFAKEMLFDLCNGNDSSYVTTPGESPEKKNLISSRVSRAKELSQLIDCHIAKTNPDVTPDYTGCSPGGSAGGGGDDAPPSDPPPQNSQRPTPSPTKTSPIQDEMCEKCLDYMDEIRMASECAETNELSANNAMASMRTRGRKRGRSSSRQVFRQYRLALNAAKQCNSQLTTLRSGVGQLLERLKLMGLDLDGCGCYEPET